MALRQQVQSLAEDLICPICLDFFTDPVSLDCGHNFCRSCITQCWEKERNSCLECREEFPERILRANRALANLTEKTRELNLNPEEKESKLHCEEHQEELKLFCETDKKLICVICSWEHTEHCFTPIQKAVEIYKDQLKSSLDSLTLKKSAVLETEQKQKGKISEVREQSSSLQTHITSEFSKMHQLLTEKEQRLLRDLREEEERILEPMEKNLREIQENLSEIENQLSFFQKQMEQKDSKRFQEEVFGHRLRILYPDSRRIIKSDTLRRKKFTNPLGDRLWRDLLPAINPECHGAEEVSVTLDVETANPRLEVSEDLKLLRWTRTKRHLPDTKKRFMDSPCVLGSEGFPSGRHYWEVEVTGNQVWRLGVATESVERKTGVSLSPETGFWTIGKAGSQFCIDSSHPIPFHVGQIPGKVGVYLSYESGTVSFFGADTKSHLHTFTGNNFTEKLYPFFFTSDLKNCLKICSRSRKEAGPCGSP
ncbi:zinc-binding protein A33-like [Scyliorhinus torazame]|uniref:zinc-binding protein A33-like n=1 Tax=Scyliorhinus torazame TaxID=75743 RepID=UPI003B5BFD56